MGGGLGFKTDFFLVSTYVVALHILFPKWAHLRSKELMLVLFHANFWPKWVTQWLKLIHGGENQDPDFGDFPIQIAENSRKRPNFDESYLGNRLELEGK